MCKRIIFRADASLKIGTGHVMRCLTLAEALKERGDEVEFICRAHEGHLLGHVEKRGFKTHALPQGLNHSGFGEKITADGLPETEMLYGRDWLGSSQQQDVALCHPILEEIKPDWLIVDHYSLDKTWQASLTGCYDKLMVIDDLANRAHQCDLLLDQTYGRKAEAYEGLVPKKAQLLLGSEYALLRPEFAAWRDYSLQRRVNPEFKKLLITMGGVDPDNVTGDLLKVLETTSLPKELEITVVMGVTAPHLEKVKHQAELMPHKTRVSVNVSNMAEMMANADLAIGAAGATTWERCCLGLPSFIVVLAENQREIAGLLSERLATIAIGKKCLKESVNLLETMTKKRLLGLSRNAAKIVDGQGIGRVVQSIRGGC